CAAPDSDRFAQVGGHIRGAPGGPSSRLPSVTSLRARRNESDAWGGIAATRRRSCLLTDRRDRKEAGDGRWRRDERTTREPGSPRERAARGGGAPRDARARALRGAPAGHAGAGVRGPALERGGVPQRARCRRQRRTAAEAAPRLLCVPGGRRTAAEHIDGQEAMMDRGTVEPELEAKRVEADERRRRDELVAEYTSLALSLARRYARSSEAPEDLGQVALLGLVRAAARFDPQRGVTFAT